MLFTCYSAVQRSNTLQCKLKRMGMQLRNVITSAVSYTHTQPTWLHGLTLSKISLVLLPLDMAIKQVDTDLHNRIKFTTSSLSAIEVRHKSNNTIGLFCCV